MGNLMGIGSTSSSSSSSSAIANENPNANANANANSTNAATAYNYIERLSSEELKRFTEGFRRICRATELELERESTVSSHSASPPPLPPNSAANGSRPNGNSSLVTIDRKTFRQKILSAFALIPTSLADRLFDVLDDNRGNSSLSLESVLNGIACLQHGTSEERENLLFFIYDLDRNGLVTRDTLTRFLEVVYGRKRAHAKSSVAFLEEIFEERKALMLEEFKQVVHTKDVRGTSLLTEWLDVLTSRIGQSDDEDILAVEKRYNPIVIRHRVSEATQFAPSEISALEQQFSKVFATKNLSRVSLDRFVKAIGQEFYADFVERATRCNQMSTLSSGSGRDSSKSPLQANGCSIDGFRPTSPSTRAKIVTFDGFCQFCSRLCRESVDARLLFMFELYKDLPNEAVSHHALEKLVAFALWTEQNESDADKGSTATKIAKQVFQELEISDSTGMSRSIFVKWAKDFRLLVDATETVAFRVCLRFGIRPDTPQVEKRIVEWFWEQSTSSFRAGNVWYLLASKWWRSWCRYVGMNPWNGTPFGDLPFPKVASDVTLVQPNEQENQDQVNGNGDATTRRTPIANWSLLHTSGSRRLKENLVLGQDFHVVPSAAYHMLLDWYNGGPGLARYLVPKTHTSMVNGKRVETHEIQLELFPLVLRIARIDGASRGVIMSGEEVLVTQLSTRQSLLEACCKALLFSKLIAKTRLWYFNDASLAKKTRVGENIRELLAKLTQNCVFLVEVQDEDGSWPLSQNEQRKTSVASGKPSSEMGHLARKRQRSSDVCSRSGLDALNVLGLKSGSTIEAAAATDSDGAGDEIPFIWQNRFTGNGLVGLDNLGNTCYLSSALQCLSHTRLLCEYFECEAYLRDLNLQNRDGTEGRLVMAFGELLLTIWTSQKERFAPTMFKSVLSKYYPQFVGAEQHDAQELLAVLLSGLSEDLNRIVKKPYIEQPDSNGRSDAIVADEWWQGHLQREVSVIVALFTGQYKSLLECSTCHYESARFEPFTFLQLSLPESNLRSITMTIIFNSERIPMRYSVRAKSSDTIWQVKKSVWKLFLQLNEAVDEESIDDILIARTSSLNTIETILDNDLPLSCIGDRDNLCTFQLERVEAVKLTLDSFVNGDHAVNKPKHADQIEEEEGDRAGSKVVDLAAATSTPEGSTPPVNEVLTSRSESSLSSSSSASPIRVDLSLIQEGSSVLIQNEKTKESLTARILTVHPNARSCDIVFASGNKRYNVPIRRFAKVFEDEIFVFLVHRRIERLPSCFASAHVTRLFGAPLVLRLSLKQTTVYDLYLMIWKRLRRIFNWTDTPTREQLTTKEISSRFNLDLTCDCAIQSQIATIALGRQLAMTQFGFCLRYVVSSGTGCSRCEWLEGCYGCLLVPVSDQTIQLAAEETIAIDWDMQTLKEDYDPDEASKVEVDSSTSINAKADNLHVGLHDCLRMFTAKEPIAEAFCSRCKKLQPAVKTMDLWRLPPILVIHLKRFCYTQYSRRKLLNFVDFPLKGLDLSEFMVKKPYASTNHGVSREDMERTGLCYWAFLGGKLAAAPSASSPNEAECKSTSHEIHSHKHEEQQEDQRGERTATTTNSSTSDPGVVSSSETSHVLKSPGGAAGLYDLYAVINHVGALGTGHYFSYILSEHDGKWKCFNDHLCKEIDASQVVSSSAYILFYRRRDLSDVKITDIFPPNARSSVSQEELRQLIFKTKDATTLSTTSCTIC